MRNLTLAISGIEALIIAYWIGAFARTIGSVHERWYFEFPFLFLVLPAVATVIAIKIDRSSDDRRLVTHLFLLGLLFLNVLAFAAYGAMSGGGV